ncbi:MAG: phosphoribosyltransferase [Catenulispora sp.]|nr:phosphoribosyltransferase [Catenulispora sp.]
MYFVDRHDAGQRLAPKLRPLRGPDVVVLGLPRGGVPVAAEVARILDAPLDVVMVRKLGVPFQPEVAMGAIGEDGVRVVDDEVRHAAGVTDADLAAIQAGERAELDRRVARYRRGHARADLRGRTALVVDDGLATGSTARAACLVARAQGAARVVLAVPVASPDRIARLADVADEVVYIAAPNDFRAVGQYYRDFAPTTDEEVVQCLDAAEAETGAGSPGDTTSRAPGTADAPRSVQVREVRVQAGSTPLEGTLAIPPDATGIVVFAHGSGSSRHSTRNRFVAQALHRVGLATLLFDLLTAEEERDRANVFDVALLADRLTGATQWLRDQPEVRDLPVGYFGASTGAAAALWAAAEPGSPVAVVVSRGGRPDLAAKRLPMVTAPTLLIVGGADDQVLRLNRQAELLLGGPSSLAIVPGATHLFSEPGALEQVAQLAADWFTDGIRGTFATAQAG